MSATRTAQAFPGTQQLAAAFGVVLLAIAVTLVIVFGVLATPKAAVTAPAAGVAPTTWDHGASSDASNISIAPAPSWDHGASSDASNVSLSNANAGSNRLNLQK
jgi:hypothetical protein